MNLVLKIIKLFPPEAAHLMALYSLKALHHLNLVNIFFSNLEHQKIEFLGMTLANRLGTAAGLDKNGDFIDCIGAIGFGFVEVGTITPKAQVGNTKPRVFRIFEEEAIINQLGFNNKEFLNSFNTDQLSNVMNFFNTMPKLRHPVKVKNKNTGVESEVILEGLENFL